MRFFSSLALIVGLVLAAPIAAPAPAGAAGVGVVLLHARNSFPTQFDGIVPRLTAAGYQSVAVNACWSARRSFAGTAAACQSDVDAAIADLKARGMDKFVVAGNDFGGMYALYYAGNHPEIAGVVAWGPRATTRSGNDETLATALRAVKAGQGDKPGAFNDGRSTTANAMLSFEGPDSVFADQEALLRKVTVPVLWLAANDDLGTRDPTARFKLIKPAPLTTLMWSVSDQYSMVDVSLPEVIAWLGKVKAGQ
jgi:pimeloyl-ACP methyl ester carboxylesterase